jgi:hypothetical protein
MFSRGNQNNCEEQFTKISNTIATKLELEDLILNYNSGRNSDLTTNAQIEILTKNLPQLKKLKLLDLNFGNIPDSEIELATYKGFSDCLMNFKKLTVLKLSFGKHIF